MVSRIDSTRAIYGIMNYRANAHPTLTTVTTPLDLELLDAVKNELLETEYRAKSINQAKRGLLAIAPLSPTHICDCIPTEPYEFLLGCLLGIKIQVTAMHATHLLDNKKKLE